MNRPSLHMSFPWHRSSLTSSQSSGDNFKRHQRKRHKHHKHHHKTEAALFQVKWKRLDDYGHEANHHRYHIRTLKGSIDLLQSTSEPLEFKLYIDAEEQTLDIPLPSGVDWNVTSQSQDLDDSGSHAQVVQLSYVTLDTQCKVKMLIGLPFDDDGTCCEAQRFSDTIMIANLQSGISGGALNEEALYPHRMADLPQAA